MVRQRLIGPNLIHSLLGWIELSPTTLLGSLQFSHGVRQTISNIDFALFAFRRDIDQNLAVRDRSKPKNTVFELVVKVSQTWNQGEACLGSILDGSTGYDHIFS